MKGHLSHVHKADLACTGRIAANQLKRLCWVEKSPKSSEVTMSVDETAIRQWAGRHECRSNLPILIRRLIGETAKSLDSMGNPPEN